MATLEDITSARTAAESAQSQYGQLAGYGQTVGDVIKQKALDAYNASQDIIKPLDVATQEYLTAPQVAREKYQDIFNPFSREKLVAQYVGNQSLPMLSLSSILGQRFGRIEDIIGAGTRAYQAQTTSAQSAAELARQHYSDLMTEYQLTQPQNQWLDLGTTKALVDEMGNIISSLPVTETGSGGGVDMTDLFSLLGLGQGMASTPTEPKPTYTPPTEGAISQGGQWYFVGSQYYPDDWIPIVD